MYRREAVEILTLEVEEFSTRLSCIIGHGREREQEVRSP